MADKEKKDSKINPPRIPKPNYQIWVILALVGVILAISLFNQSNELVEIQSSRFEDMVQRRDIKKLVPVSPKSDNWASVNGEG